MIHTLAANLPLGDGLMATPAVAALRDAVPARDVVEVALCWPAGEPWPQHWDVWDHFPGVVVNRCRGVRAESLLSSPGRWTVRSDGGARLLTLDVPLAFSATAGERHMAHGFADQLGVELKSLDYTFSFADREVKNPLPMGAPFAVLAPFSNSCASRSGGPANNMIPWPAWAGFARRLGAAHVFPLVVSHNEEPPPEATPRDLLPGWMNGRPIRQVAWWCRRATAVVSVDTGIAHLACAVGANIVSIRGGRAACETSVAHTRGRHERVDKPVAEVTADDLWAAYQKVAGC